VYSYVRAPAQKAQNGTDGWWSRPGGEEGLRLRDQNRPLY
jgi:hypothetical protein